MLSTVLGLTPAELNAIYITFGAGKPLTYSHTGYAVSAMFGHRIKERDFRPRFLRLCAKGMVSFQGWDDLWLSMYARTVVALPKSVDAIRDVQIAMGGDYHYYRYFDPYEDYEKNPNKMDRFLKGSLTVKGQQRNISRRQLFEAQFKNHKKDPRTFRWF